MTLEALWRPRWHHPHLGLAGMRVTLALVLLTHPLAAALHPAGHGVPTALGLAVLALGGVLLLVPRTALVGAGLCLLVVAADTAARAPRWFVLGGEVTEGQPGMEYGVLLLVMLGAVAWAARRPAEAPQAFQLVALGSALLLLPHGYGAFLKHDTAGMRAWGEAMSAAGWPMGVALVWGVKVVELVGVLLRLARRLVIPACLGHLAVLLTGMVISQEGAWFDVGEGEGGIEFPLVLCVGALLSIFSTWPRRAVTPP